MKLITFRTCLFFLFLGIGANAQITVSASTTANVICHGGSTGSVSSSVSGGTTPYTYSWSPGGGTNSTKTALAAGTYTVHVTDHAGLTGSASTTVTQPAALGVSAVTKANETCHGGSTGSVSCTPSGGTTPYTYLWTGGGTSATITGLTAGTYTITLKDNCGASVTASATVTQPIAVSVTASVTANETCRGGSTGSVSSTPTNGTSPYTYSWTGGSTNSTETGLTAGLYTITVTDNCGATATARATITQPNALTVSTSVTGEVTCRGGSNGSVSSTPVNGTSPYTYSWSGGGTNSTKTGLTAGVYTITVTDNCGATATATANVTQPAVLTVAATITSQISCHGGSNGSASSTPSGGTSPFTYSWTGGGTNSTYTGLTAGGYTVTVTDNCGNTATAHVTITQPATALSVTANTTANETCGGGNTGSVSSTPSGGTSPYTYSWSGGGTNSNYTGLTAGNYTITVTDNHGCTATASTAITQPVTLSVSLSGPNLECNNTTDYCAAVTGGAMPYTYSWNLSNGTIIGSTDSSCIKVNWTNPAIQGMVYVTVTDAHGCTTSKDSLQVSICIGMFCGDDSIYYYEKRADTSFLTQVTSMNNAINNWINHPEHAHAALSGSIYYIPVVVHIIADTNDPLYTYCKAHSLPYVPYAQVQSEINALNEAYSYYGNVDSGAPRYQTNAKIQFCLAKTAINGTWTNPLQPGVMRYYGNSSNPTLYNAAHIATLNPINVDAILTETNQNATPSSPFPFADYLNIYVVNDIEGSCGSGLIEGFTPQPLNVGFSLDGIVMRADVFGDNTYCPNCYVLQPDPAFPTCIPGNPTVQFSDGKIGAHEGGHYLDVWHPFQPSFYSNGNCVPFADCHTDGDFCCETSPCQAPATNYICGSGQPPYATSCNPMYTDSVPTGDLMYYSVGTCWNYFTDDQVARMQGYLNVSRSNLFSTSNLAATGVLQDGCVPSALYSDFYYSPVAPCLDSTITFSSVPNPPNSATSYAWSFGANATPSTSASPTVTVTYTVAGTYPVTLTVINASHDTSTSTYSITVNSCALDSNYYQNAQWYFGQYENLSFTSGVAKPTYNAFFYPADTQTIFAGEGAYCYNLRSNTSQALYYSNTQDVWVPGSVAYPLPINSTPVFPSIGNYQDHMPPPHGQSKLTSSQYGIMGCPDPGNSNQYYLFAAPCQEDLCLNPLNPGRYAVVNPTAATVGTTKLLNSDSVIMGEGLTIVPHCNGKDYWIILHSLSAGDAATWGCDPGMAHPNSFYVYLLSSLGLSNAPQIFPCTNQDAYTVVSIKASPDSKYLLINGGYTCALYNFDASTGVISNEQVVPSYTYTPGGPVSVYTGVSFGSSTNPTQYFYTMGEQPFQTLVQYEINGSGHPVIENQLSAGGNNLNLPMNGSQNYYYMQLGPNDNIYMAENGYAGSNTLIDMITGANSNTPSFIPGAVDFSTLPGWNTYSGVGNTISIPNLMDAVKPSPSTPHFAVEDSTCSCVKYSIPCMGGYNYSWSFGCTCATPTTSTSATPTVCYSTPGTYTVTCTLTVPGNVGTIVITQPVVILGTTTTISGTDSVCIPGTFPFTYQVDSIAGATYAWTVSANGTITGASNQYQLNVNWNSVGTGTVSVTITDGGCTSTGTLHVAVDATPTITVTPSPTSICLGSSTILTASGATTYVWTDGATNSTSNPITVMPSVTTTYTVYGTTNGCTSSTTDTVFVDTSCTTCYDPHKFSIILNNQNISSLDTNLLHDDTVLINGTLTIDSNVTFSGGDFEFTPGSRINIINNRTLTIGDSPDRCIHLHAACDSMWRGIFINPGSKLIVATQVLVEDADSAIVAISSGSTQGIYQCTSAPYEPSIFNKNYINIVVEPTTVPYQGYANTFVFTCRDLSAIPCDPHYWSSQPFTTLLPPHAGQITHIGWLINSVQDFTDNNAISSNEGVNTFDNVEYGIYSLNSNTKIATDTFRNIYSSSQPWAAIYARGAISGSGDTLIVGAKSSGNIFTNCTIGVVADTGFQYVDVAHNKMTDLNSEPGGYGVLVRAMNRSGDSLLIDQDTITNFNIGIGTSMNNYGSAIINYNIITVDTTTSLNWTGVALNEATSSTIKYIVDANTIKIPYRGITLNGLNNAYADANNIYLDTLGSSNYLANGGGIVMQNCNTVEIGCNSVTTTYTPNTFTGIVESQSKSITVENNTTTNTNLHIRYSGALSTLNSAWTNTLNLATGDTGIISTNSAVVTFGATGNAANNDFYGSACRTSNITGSSMTYWYISAALTLPTPECPTLFAAHNTVGSTTHNCTSVVSRSRSHSMLRNTPDTTIIDSADIAFMENIALSKDTFDVVRDTSIVIAKEGLLTTLWENPYLLSNPIFEHFDDSMNSAPIGRILAIDTTMVSSSPNVNYSSLLSSLNAIIPINNIEANLQIATQGYLLYRMNGTLSINELTTLRMLANKCSDWDGTGVYQARALLSLFDPPSTVYPDFCGSDNHELHKAYKNGASNQVFEPTLSLYPNPNNGNFTLEYNLGKGVIGKVLLYNTLGEQIGEYNLNGSEGSMNISNTNLSNGVYLWKLYSDNQITKYGKVVIMR